MICRLAAVTCLALSASQVSADTHSVDPSGMADFISIQAAVSASTEGDTILLAAGTYTERVVIPIGGIEILGSDGSGSTTIIGDGLAPLFLVQPDTTSTITFTGITLTNGGDSAIYATGANLYVEDLVITESGAIDIDGGGIYAYQSTLELYNTTITESLGFNGGAIHLDNSSIALSNCEITTNSGENGGAVYGTNQSSIVDENSSFSYNSATASGGALYFDGPDDGLSPLSISLSGSTVDGNSSGLYGGGITTYYTGQISIDNSSVSYNYSYDDGAGLFIYHLDGELSISNSNISNNTGQYNTGGGIYAYKYTDLFIENTTINQNSAYSHGGGIYVYNRSVVDISGSNISYNASGAAGGGVYSRKGYETDPVFVTDSTFVGNVSLYEAAGMLVEETETSGFYRNVFSGNSAGDDAPGGGLFIRESTDFEIINNLFYGNDSGFGGGLAIGDVDETLGPYTLTNNIFQENIGGYGGGLFVHGAPRPEGIASFGSHWGSESEEIVDFYVEEVSDAISGDWVAHIDYDYSLCTDEAYSVFDGIIKLPVNEQPTGGSIWINSSDPNAEIGVRLQDAEEEVFWYYIGTVLGTGWIQYNLSDYNDFPSNSNWSGNDDNIFDPPLTKLGIQIYGNGGNSGSVQFDNVIMQYELAGPVVVADYEQVDFVVEGYNNTFVGNIGLEYGAGVAVSDTAINLTNNAFAHNSGTPAVEYLDSDSSRTSINQHNGWFSNTPVTEGLAGEGAVTTSPEWAHYERDATPANDNFTLLVDSPYIDAGMVEISDPTGGRSDIGSNGGPSAIWVDADGDGFTTMNDCDDTDPTVNPNGSDEWYDGINSDCMSGSDYDQDGDGFDSKEFTPDEAGTDCDDSDASITDDCGTGDDGGGVEEPAECGCTAGSRSGGGWLVLLALSGLVRRRRA